MKKVLFPSWPLRLVALLVLGLLSSCTQNLFVSKKPLAAPAALTVGPDYQYKLRKDDKITLSVFDHEELSIGSIYGHYPVSENEGKWELVDAQGNLSVPRVGVFHVEGLTLLEAETQLEKLMAKWIVNPQITLKVLNLQATVLGEVNAPGNQHLEKERTTLVEVLGRAGDFGVYADKRHVKVLRQNAQATMATEINLMTMTGFEQNNLVILPGDVVYVPSKNGKQFDRKSPTILGIGSIISTFFIALRFFQQQ
ncbi:MAG: polysaccharide export protein [Hymenobacter sp.]|nr:MAG: polysaccharide export protein [Hymenobacter sp.]